MEEEGEYRVYKSRWGILWATALMSVANNILWISFASVNTQSASYYEVSGADIDFLTTISFIVGIPVCAASTYTVNRYGLKKNIHFATYVTFLGGLMRFVSTMPGVRDSLSKDGQYIMGIVAQAITGLGNPFSVALPTKVSQHWFPEHETIIATSVLAVSLPVGISLGYGVTTAFVLDADDVPTMNWAWFVPAVLSLLVTLVFVRSDYPPTPPSKSSQYDQESQPYLKSMKGLFTNKNYLVIVFSIGGAVGFVNAFLTLLQKILCSRNYDSWYAGLCGSLLLGTGFIGAIIMGLIAEKTGKLEETAKISFCFAGLAGIMVTVLAREYDQEWAFGIFGFGAYPLALELSVESTYPIDEAAGTAIIFISGQLQGTVLIILSEFMEEELPNGFEESCTELGGGDDFFEGKDHTNFLILLCVYLTTIGCVFVAFFHTDYNRQRANRERDERERMQKQIQEENTNVSVENGHENGVAVK